MRISESRAKYIQVIYQLSFVRGYVLAVDVANYLSYSKPSVSVAMKDLHKMGMIENGLHNEICLTKLGRDLAEQLQERYTYFYLLLTECGMDERSARLDAQKMMSAISEEGFQKLCRHSVNEQVI